MFFSPADKPHEECGVFGIVANDNNQVFAAGETYTALFALQHRGQESCGIAVSDGSAITVKKGEGLLTDVFNESTIRSLSGRMAIGHVRYGKHCDLGLINAQPFRIRHMNGELAVAFNGTLTNTTQLRAEIEMRGGIFQTTVDAETIAYTIVHERMRAGSLQEAMLSVMSLLRGAYSIVLIAGNQLIALRDPNGFRPLCMGRLPCGSVVFASESCALDAIGAHFERDVLPGEMIVVEQDEVRSIQSGIASRQSLCVFEYIYFARPDSVIDGVSVDKARQNAGRVLARRNKNSADVVVGVPDSGLSSAMGFATESGIPYSMGIVKNRYVGRTFIQPYQKQRERSVHLKLNAMRSCVEGKRVILVDDSIVRGTTCAKLVNMLREAGASEVHLRIASPPFRFTCHYGTDIACTEDLVAYNRTIEQIAEISGADSLDFLPVEAIPEVVEGLTCGFCQACFNGDYPVPVSDNSSEDADSTSAGKSRQ